MSTARLMVRGDGVPVLAAPWRITFDTNPDDCNLSCVMCEEHSDLSEKKHLRVLGHRSHRRMDIGTLRQVVAEMAPRGLREIIPSTMGEPLLYQHFDEILDVCREHDVYLNLTTNGTWPRLGPEEWGVRLCPLTSDVKVSWNGSSSTVQESVGPCLASCGARSAPLFQLLLPKTSPNESPDELPLRWRGRSHGTVPVCRA